MHRLLEAVDPRGGRWLEPTAGRGDLMVAVKSRRDDISWTGVELYVARAKHLAAIADDVIVGDVRKVDLDPHYDVALSNPPFSIWKDVVMRVLPVAKTVVMLLRLDVLGSAGRLSTIEPRLKLLKAAPDVFSLEVRRIEAGVRKRIDHLHDLLGRDVEEARKVLESLLDGPMKFTPIETAEGARYEVTGRIATGDVLRVLSGRAGAREKEADTARTKPYPQRGRPYVDEFRTALIEQEAA